MSDKKQNSISGDNFERMVDTMITLANRGRKQTELVKRIAKAGDVQPVMEYIVRFHKMFQKFSAEAPTRQRTPDAAPAKRKGSKRRSRKVQASEASGE